MKILIDMDGIVCNTLPLWLQRIGHKTSRLADPEKRRVVAQVEDIKLWDIMKCPPLDRLDPRLVFGILEDPDFIHSIPPIFGAIEGVKTLIDAGHEVYLVTARHGPNNMAGTLSWIDEHMPFIDKEKQLIFCYNKDLIPADILIDDKPQTLANYGKKYPQAWTIAIRYPYNEKMVRDRLKIFGSANYLDHTLTWGQICGYIEALKEFKQLLSIV